MNLEKIKISCDRKQYSAWPDVALAGDGRLLCVFTECVHHMDHSKSQIMICESNDNGSVWSPKRPFTESSEGKNYYYNCARIMRLPDNRMCVAVDCIPATGEKDGGDSRSYIVLYFSADDGHTWSNAIKTPIHGIVPDKLTVLDNGRWLLATHYKWHGKETVFVHYSDDEGKSWSRRITVAHSPRLRLCEASMLPLGNGVVAAFMRENSFAGMDCRKVLSLDNGETWGEITAFPLPGCHRPVAGLLRDGRLMVTYRFVQGCGGFGSFTQNFFCAFADRKAALESQRNNIPVRIVPIDYDRSRVSDTGYSGWVELPNGNIFIVNYIVDDAVDHGQIRGYLFPLNAIFC